MYRRPIDQTVCDALIANGTVIKPSPLKQTVCDGGSIKHDSEKIYVCESWHTVDPYELFAMSQNNRNGQPVRGVCDTRHTVHLDELFAISQHNRNSQPDQGVCDIRHIVHSDELFVLIQNNRNGST